MYKLVNISDSEFNSYLDSNNKNIQNYTFTQSVEWARIQNQLGFKNHQFGLKDSKDILVGVAQCIEIHAKRGKYLYIRNGPVSEWSEDIIKAWISELKDFAVKNKLWFVRISPLIQLESSESLEFKKYNFPKFQMNDVEALDTWLTDLSEEESKILSKLDKKTRYYVNKTYKDGVTALITQDISYLKEFYSIYQDTVKRHQWNAYSYSYLETEVKEFLKLNKCYIILTKFQDQFIAGGIFIVHGKQLFYHHGASLTEFSKLSAQYQTIWEAIKLAKNLNLNHFNFWGITSSKNPKHPWFGLTSFKKKFYGFEQKWQPAIDIPVSPLYWLTYMYDKLDTFKKGY